MTIRNSKNRNKSLSNRGKKAIIVLVFFFINIDQVHIMYNNMQGFQKKSPSYLFSIIKSMKIFLCMKCVTWITFINIVLNDACNILKTCLFCIYEMKCLYGNV
jgi:hypothetical protein